MTVVSQSIYVVLYEWLMDAEIFNFNDSATEMTAFYLRWQNLCRDRTMIESRIRWRI